MPDFPLEAAQGQLDAQFAVLVALLVLAMFFLLAPTGRPGRRSDRRPSAPTEDTTKTRRLP